MPSAWVMSTSGTTPPDSITRESVNYLVRCSVIGLVSQSTSVLVISSVTELVTGWQLP